MAISRQFYGVSAIFAPVSELDDYNAKRRFMRTPEPFGAAGESDPDALRFVVQRHLARRPHFDLRLELGGVLKSFAVPEGPSLDPAHRRLAIATEDHPLAYAAFEGVIPEGEYGAGALALWDSGGWVPLAEDPAEALEAGEIKFRLTGGRLGGGWMLKKLPGDGKEWLLIKERDSFVEKGFAMPPPENAAPPVPPALPGVAAALPKRLSPQLPSPVDSPPEGEGWLHEIKFDGYRTLIRKDSDQVRFLTRQGLDWTERYAALIPHVQALDCGAAFLDGEVCVQDARGATSLELLQQALSENRGHDLVFYAFDLIHCDGHDLTEVPLLDRKALLRRLVPADPMSRVQYSDHFTGAGRALFSQVVRIGLEGVVSKQARAPYRQERTKTWVKAKRFDVAVFDVIGFTTKGSSRHVASLILASGGEAPAYVGRAGTGLSLGETRALYEAFTAIETERAPVEVPKTPNAHFIPTGRFSAEISYRGRSTKNIIRHAAILDVRAAEPAPRGKAPARLITDRDLASIRLTNPDRVYGATGATKLDIALYYARVGERMLPGLLNRPVTLIRCPGADLEDRFYQRHGFAGLPDGVETMGDRREDEFLVIREPRGFLGLPQFGVIEFHPWDCTVEDLDHPDRMIVDLDPGEGTGWAAVVTAAGLVREALAGLGLAAFVRTTGGAGLHLAVPLAPEAPWAEVHGFQKAFARHLARAQPRLFTDQLGTAKRAGRIYLDVNRSQFGASTAASYSLRAKSGFGVAMPLAWSELSATMPPSEFDRENVLIRLEKRGSDPWADFEDARATISSKARRSVGLKL